MRNDKRIIKMIFAVVVALMVGMFINDRHIANNYQNYENAEVIRILAVDAFKVEDEKLVVNNNLNNEDLLRLNQNDQYFGNLDKAIGYKFDNEMIKKDYYEVYNQKKAKRVENKEVKNPNLAERVYIAIKNNDDQMRNEINKEMENINVEEINVEKFKKDNKKMVINHAVIMAMAVVIVFMMVFLV